MPCDKFLPVGRLRLIRILALSVAALSLYAMPAMGAKRIRPRSRGAMGIIPARGHQEIASGSNIPVLYHGGPVMRGGVTIHTIFWAPAGYHFTPSPGAGVLGYEPLIKQFFADAAHDSGATTNVFSVLRQYPDSGGPGSYQISYDPAVDSYDATDPYPPTAQQCPSPSSIPTCITDLQLQHEIDRVIQAHDPTGRGLHDLWMILLPPNVDTCTQVGECGTNVFAGYHDLSNLGHGVSIYAVIIDPLIEGVLAQGGDPEGNPEAENAIDTAAHETVEAITDPEGTAWMDPNGFEVGDKCENGSQTGTPLGYAPDQSPYNQLMNGHEYLFQEMWSNSDMGCEQSSSSTSSPLPLASVNLRQFSPFISGDIGSHRGGVPVDVSLLRGADIVATASARTRANGAWGAAELLSSHGRPHAVGDDRDQVLVSYGSGGPPPDLILTGDGGNPFTESGWTGWYALDTGYAVGTRGVLLGPCSQTGVLALRVGGHPTVPPVSVCEAETDVSEIRTSISARTPITLSSSDNRAVWQFNPNGALVNMTISLGEPDAVTSLGNDQLLFQPTGFPVCTVDLRGQSVSCRGLVPGARYTVTRRRRHAARHATADGNGDIFVNRFPRGIAGGDLITLTNRSGRTLSTLHVAHLRVAIKGGQTVVASGRCEPGDYYGPPVSSVPLGPAIGLSGVAGNGLVCPDNGHAGGLPSGQIEQTDEFSGGVTRTEVPVLSGTSPVNDGTVYGSFTALAQTALPGPNGTSFGTGTRVQLTITPVAGGPAVFKAGNVDTTNGAAVSGLAAGTYLATWVVIDVNGDTRTVRTRFVEQG